MPPLSTSTPFKEEPIKKPPLGTKPGAGARNPEAEVYADPHSPEGEVDAGMEGEESEESMYDEGEEPQRGPR